MTYKKAEKVIENIDLLNQVIVEIGECVEGARVKKKDLEKIVEEFNRRSGLKMKFKDLESGYRYVKGQNESIEKEIRMVIEVTPERVKSEKRRIMMEREGERYYEMESAGKDYGERGNY